MSTFLKRTMIVVIGLLGGIAVWPFLEITITYQNSFPSYLISTLIQGLAVGGILGSFLGAAEGLLSRSAKKIQSGAIIGGITGAIGGIAGFYIGQSLLLFLGQFFRLYGQPMIQILGWVVLGAFVGAAEGIHSRNGIKIFLGLSGGIIGGFLGGFFLEYTSRNVPDFTLGRLFGLALFSGSIALAYSLLEKGATSAVLRVLSGPYKGKEFPVLSRKSLLGSSNKAAVSIEGYEGLEPAHAYFIRKGKRIHIKKAQGEHTLKVNDRAVQEAELKWDDVIEAGTVKLLITAS